MTRKMINLFRPLFASISPLGLGKLCRPIVAHTHSAKAFRISRTPYVGSVLIRTSAQDFISDGFTKLVTIHADEFCKCVAKVDWTKTELRAEGLVVGGVRGRSS